MSRPYKIGLGAGLLLTSLFATVSSGQTSGKPIDGIDEHFAIASKRYGEGNVKLHSRSGGTHTVHSFNCVEQTFEKVFEAEDAPQDFPVEWQGNDLQPFDAESQEMPLARHACEEHGLQIIEFKW